MIHKVGTAGRKELQLSRLEYELPTFGNASSPCAHRNVCVQPKNGGRHAALAESRTFRKARPVAFVLTSSIIAACACVENQRRMLSLLLGKNEVKREKTNKKNIAFPFLARVVVHAIYCRIYAHADPHVVFLSETILLFKLL